MPDKTGPSPAGSGTPISYPTAPPAEIERILALRSHDPHATLGAHPSPRGIVVRAFRPGAAGIELLVEGEGPRSLVRSHPAGFFELVVEDRAETFPYRLRVSYPDGNVFTHRDPYSFLPTLGNFDEHLFNEGRHWNLYDKLGAHVQDYGTVRGVSFAVWAPNAGGVSVVGDFNSWDGRLHQMRRLGASGVWEIFVPDIGPGEIGRAHV